jgi:hypothetical protein
MRNAFMIGAIFALATAVGPTASLAQGNAGAAAMHLSAAGSAASAQADSRTVVGVDGAKSLARADKATVKHGQKGNLVRTRGANKPGFCPPGQAKKPGPGSRFQC